MNLPKELLNKIESKKSVVAIIGLGYVGLPLAHTYCNNGYKVLGFDISKERVDLLNNGKHYLNTHFTEELLKKYSSENLFSATNDFTRIKEVDAIIICVPTPIDIHHVPDLSYVVSSVTKCLENSKKHQVISLESTTYPGTTDDIVVPIVEKMGYTIGKDYFVIYSPEREDPSNPDFTTHQIPKVVAGHTKNCLEIAKALYRNITEVVPVSSIRVAEMTKILENTYRGVNIAFINEMKMICNKMNIDIFEIIDAAKTKPFGFTAYYPGPGVGGHCIPVDPYYLSWKAKEFGVNCKFIELSSDMNFKVQNYVINRLFEILNNQRKTVNNSKILILGLSYKKNVADMRESPSLPIALKLQNFGAILDFHDPYVSEFSPVAAHGFYDLKLNHSITLNKEAILKYDAVLILTDHKDVDYKLVQENAKIIVDTRGVYKNNRSDNVFFA